MAGSEARAATDTIVATVTAAGRAAVGIIRLSGPQAVPIAERVCGSLGADRQAVLRDFRDIDGAVIDRGLVLYFRQPRSFTGEQVVELQAHGGSLVMALLQATALAAGARLARPGEFSERAFLNGQLDLVQAEAIADLIDAGSAAAARAASRSLHGEFSQRVAALVEQLIRLRADLEAALDFADESDVPWISSGTLMMRIDLLRTDLASVRRAAGQGRRLRDGMTVAIVGRPNVGKSTLLNRLTGADSAIVSPLPGTTRDLLREQVEIDGLTLTLIDTAGLRETDEPIEREGVRRARAAQAQAELVMFVVDDGDAETAADRALLADLPPEPQVLIVRNKCDLSGNTPVRFTDAQGRNQVRIAAANAAGLELLHAALVDAAGLAPTEAGTFSARARHVHALDSAAEHLNEAAGLAVTALASELIAEELRLAQQALDEITGRFTSDDLLGRIFSSFCLGK